jgi:hypothetical protein
MIMNESGTSTMSKSLAQGLANKASAISAGAQANRSTNNQMIRDEEEKVEKVRSPKDISRKKRGKLKNEIPGKFLMLRSSFRKQGGYLKGNTSRQLQCGKDIHYK